MSRVLVIDYEAKSLEEIKKALAPVDSQTYIQTHFSFKDFDAHQTAHPDDVLNFDLMLLDYSLLKPAEWTERLTTLRARNQNSTAPICFLSYDSVAVNRKFIFGLHVYNIFYKPYDPLILQESINLALKSQEPIKLLEMKPQAAQAYVGILKEVQMTSMNELGFETLNDTALVPKSVSKYYGELFSSGKKQSVWAQCFASKPSKAHPELYVNQFHYVGIEADVLAKIRRHLQRNKAQCLREESWIVASVNKERKLKIALVSLEVDPDRPVQQNIVDHFKNVEVDFLTVDPVKKLAPPEIHYDAVINLNSLLKEDLYREAFKADAVHFLMVNGRLTDETYKERAPLYDDIFITPLDKGYFFRKLKLHLPDLIFSEEFDLLTIRTEDKLKAANLVKLSEMSELYLSFYYHRELAKASFREFAFVTEDENQIVQMPAFCHHAEKGPADGKNGVSYLHQFAFWGTTDHLLKQIRLWLLHNHIVQNKDKAS